MKRCSENIQQIQRRAPIAMKRCSENIQQV